MRNNMNVYILYVGTVQFDKNNLVKINESFYVTEYKLVFRTVVQIKRTLYNSSSDLPGS